MIYLDYAANTPVDEEVVKTFYDVSLKFIANPNSSHKLGMMAKEKLDQCTANIAELLNVKESEIIYTSGASESNNLAVKGIAEQYKKYGKHIITTYLEHSSVNGAMGYLQNLGFQIEYVDINPDGSVDLESLKSMMRDDTILVSICTVDSEIGLKQSIDKIGEIINKYPHCYFHTDATQSVGKIPLNFEHADLITFAPHKFYGLNGCGVLIKKEKILLEPLIHGGISTSAFRSGTPALNMITATEKALKLSYENMNNRFEHVQYLNNKLRAAFKKYDKVKINSTENSVPFILNISLNKINTEIFKQNLEKENIFLSTKSACCAPNTVSRPVYALTKDRQRSLSTLRISLSHLTKEEEIDIFLEKFDELLKNQQSR